MKKGDNGRRFVAFVQKLRKEQELTLEQVCDGLCSPVTLNSIENGKWKPDKLLRDRILGRLGVDTESYEHFLDLTEYMRWEMRQQILHCITYEKIDQAQVLLEEYRLKYCMGDRLEKQFYLGMLVQIIRFKGDQKRVISEILEEAVALTVSGIKDESMKQLVLSVRELNLILEAEHCRKEGEQADRYRGILKYIDKKMLDRIGRAKIYPKAVYFLCRCVLAPKGKAVEGRLLKELMEYCEKAIELLRENARMYYLWEILKLEEWMTEVLMERYAGWGQQEKAEGLNVWYRQRKRWRQALETVYAEEGVRKETEDFCYFYVDKGCYCINDVIRKRRQMLGMTCVELCQGICTERTLRRLERKETQPQWAVVEGLLNRLRLPVDYTRAELMTDSREAGIMMDKLHEYMKDGLWDQAELLLENIRGMASTDIYCNRQVLESLNLFCRWKKKEIGDSEYYLQIRNVLELTLSYKLLLKSGEKYLTNEEQACIGYMMLAMDKKSEEYVFFRGCLEEINKPNVEAGRQAVAGMNEFVLCNLGNALGEIEALEISEHYDESVLQECLRFHRMEAIHLCIYNKWRNHDMRRKQNIKKAIVLDEREELTNCILFADMIKDVTRAQFYRRLFDKQ